MDAERIELIRSRIRDVPDFPKPGIMFKDITPLLDDPEAFNAALDSLQAQLSKLEFDLVVGIESRGFIFGAALAARMHRGFAPVRKPGKLPAATFSVEYELEYGTDVVEIHQDTFDRAKRAVIVDDLLATGGTAAATVQLIEKAGGSVVAAAFVIELGFLDGRERLAGVETHALLRY